MKFDKPAKILVLLIGCLAVTVEAISGNGPINATSVLTVAGTIAF